MASPPNPNPAIITHPMWRLWTDRPNPEWKLGGIYANKRGYHNSVIANQVNWSDNYSIRLPLDLVKENRSKARAIDLTMSRAEMVVWTYRMRSSALDPEDPRLAAVREFYGTLDGVKVYGLIKDDANGPWEPSTSDPSHLYHGHTSIFTVYVNDWQMLAPLLSVWRGENLHDWAKRSMLVSKGDSGEDVKYWQAMHNNARKTVNPPSVNIEVDGDYGDSTAAAFADFVKKQGGQPTYTGDSVTWWLAVRYNKAVSVAAVEEANSSGAIDPELIKSMVEVWLNANIPATLNIEGTLKGRLTP